MMDTFSVSNIMVFGTVEFLYKLTRVTIISAAKVKTKFNFKMN